MSKVKKIFAMLKHNGFIRLHLPNMSYLNTNHFLWRWVKTTHALTKTNYGLFCDYDIVLGLKCVLPMLELVQSLSKMVQAMGTFDQAHCVRFVYHVCRPSQKVWQPLISNLQHLGEPNLWCFTYCVVVGTIDSNWAFDIQVS